MRKWIWINGVLCLAVMLVGAAMPAAAQSQPTTNDQKTPMTVATRSAPPFSFKGADGHWTGISIELWKEISAALNIDYKFQEASLKDMIEGVADGRFGASVAAMTITAKRESTVDFTEPFYTTGYGIAVQKVSAGVWSLLRSMFSLAFLQAIIGLAAVLAIVGILTWLFERRRNPDEFGGSWLSGLGAGFWFSAVTMTTVGYGDKSPRSIGGRVVALVWMFAAVIIISTFTGAIASALTANRLMSAVSGPADLPRVAVGSVPGSASDAWLTGQYVAFHDFKDIKVGMDALAAGNIEAFVYDKPLLQYLVNNNPDQNLTLVPGTFGRQDYGIVLPQGSRLREPMNQTLLKIIESRQWHDIVFRYLGEANP